MRHRVRRSETEMLYTFKIETILRHSTFSNSEDRGETMMSSIQDREETKMFQNMSIDDLETEIFTTKTNRCQSVTNLTSAALR